METNFISINHLLSSFHMQSTLMQMVSGRARGKRFQKRRAEKSSSESDLSSKRPSLAILSNANVKVDTSSAMTDDLYEHYKKECKQGVGRTNNNDIKSMLRQTFDRRYSSLYQLNLDHEQFRFISPYFALFRFFSRLQEKKGVKKNMVSSLTVEWPVFMCGEYLLVEMLCVLGEKESKSSTMHKKAASLLRSVCKMRSKKISKEVIIHLCHFNSMFRLI